MSFPHRILAALDFTEESEGALDTAVELARTTHAELCVMTALDEHDRESEHSARMHLARVVERHGDGGIHVETRVERGNPREAIVTAATRVGADLIIMGTHARNSMPHGVSVTEAVSRATSVPVMTVRAGVPRSEN